MILYSNNGSAELYARIVIITIITIIMTRIKYDYNINNSRDQRKSHERSDEKMREGRIFTIDISGVLSVRFSRTILYLNRGRTHRADGQKIARL